MRITKTTLRRIIKEELEAVMNEADALQTEKEEAELNEEDEDVKRARERGHIGKAYDVDQNKFQLSDKYKKEAERMRKRVAKLKAKKAKG